MCFWDALEDVRYLGRKTALWSTLPWGDLTVIKKIQGTIWSTGLWRWVAAGVLLLALLALYFWRRRRVQKLIVAIKKGRFIDPDEKGLGIEDNISSRMPGLSGAEVYNLRRRGMGAFRRDKPASTTEPMATPEDQAMEVPQACPPPPVYYLEAQTPKRMRYLLFSGENLIGRDKKAVISLQDPLVSLRHACIILEKNSLYIEDLLSINGTYVNNERIRKKDLQPGDEIKIGRTIFHVTTKKK